MKLRLTLIKEYEILLQFKDDVTGQRVKVILLCYPQSCRVEAVPESNKKVFFLEGTLTGSNIQDLGFGEVYALKIAMNQEQFTTAIESKYFDYEILNEHGH